MEYGYLKYSNHIGLIGIDEITKMDRVYCHPDDEVGLKVALLTKEWLDMFPDFQVIASTYIEKGKPIATGKVAKLFRDNDTDCNQ